ncbi:MAG: hypothetical protein AT718_02175 [Vulcanisaeta sp. JCHS_4]|nr:MAG: hypothetical protein AT718_02175 [Vulcanisaeta sp. JCHS_4]
MQRRDINSVINEAGVNRLGDVLGIVERSVNEGNRLILTVGSRLSYNDIISRLFIGSYVLVIDSTTNSEVMLKVSKIENIPNPPPSIGGLDSTYVKVFGDFVITRTGNNGTYRYSSLLIIPASGSLLLYPNDETIRDFFGLRGNLPIGKAMINGFSVPVTIDSKALDKGMLIIGQPGCGKSLLTKGIIKELYTISDYRNIVIIDRTGEYTKYLVERGLNVSLLLPLDLMRLGRSIDIDELRRYVIDKLRVLGFRSKVKVKMSLSKDDGVEFNVYFPKREFGSLSVFPSSIRFRWFIERAINYLDPEVKYIVTTLMMENDKSLNTVQNFMNALRNPELLNLLNKSSINKAMDLAYFLRNSGYFDAVINVGGENIDISIYSPMRLLRNKLVIFDIHELPEYLLNVYEVVLMEDIIRWLMGLRNGKVIIVVDNAEGLMGSNDLLSTLINNVRIGRIYGVSFIIATRTFSRKLYREFGNVVFMRMSNSPLRINCNETTNLLNNEFILLSPWLNIDCIKGSIA